MRNALIAVLVAIVACDLAQPMLLAWRPKFWGALGGAAIYALCAAGVARDVPAARLVVVAMPVIPIGVLGLWATGLATSVQPDAPMVGVLALQLCAAALAAATPRRAPSP